MLKLDRSWTLFLDRDGVINRRLPGDYVRRWEEFELLEGVLPALRRFSNHFGRIVVVTNQQGIGKGLMSEDELDLIHRRLRQVVEAAGGRLDGIYHCSGLERDDPPCRKPNPGMANEARRDFPEIDFQRSLMVGDSLSDMVFGGRLGMINVLIETRAGALLRPEEAPFPFSIAYRFSGLAGLADFLETSGYCLSPGQG